MESISKTVTVEELRRLLPCQDEFIFDPVYKLPSEEEFDSAVQEFVAQRGAFNYVPGYHDCDNAAAEMMTAMSGRGWPFGMAIVTGHALCVCVINSLKLRFVEPQDGTSAGVPEKLIAVIMI